MTSALIACIGNSLVGDDGFGQAVYRQLQVRLPAQTRLLHLELGGLRLLDELQGEELLVVVDALQSGGPAGSLQIWDEARLQQAGGPPVTSHDIGLREALEIGRRLYPERMPRQTWLVGVEGNCFDQLGVGLGPEVSAAVAPATVAVEKLLADHRRSQKGKP